MFCMVERRAWREKKVFLGETFFHVVGSVFVGKSVFQTSLRLISCFLYRHLQLFFSNDSAESQTTMNAVHAVYPPVELTFMGAIQICSEC